MRYIAHRINTSQQLSAVERDFGVEVDLRDRGDRLILEHDPFGDGEDFESYLAVYKHDLMILNIKSERIEHRVLEALLKYKTVPDYFFLDSSYPMIRKLVSLGERKVAVRFSEFEPIEYALALKGQIDWVWVDCFSRLPLDQRSYDMLKPHFKLCLVSPELQGHSTDRIQEFKRQVKDFEIDAVCTKVPNLWEAAVDD